MKNLVIVTYVIACLSGCVGDDGDSDADTPQIQADRPSHERGGMLPPLDALHPTELYESAEPGPAHLRRLSRTQYKNAIADLFGPGIEIPKIAEPDVAKSGLNSVGASFVSYSPRGIESLESASYSIAQQVVDNEFIFQWLFGCAVERAACIQEQLSSLASLAFRRRVDISEVEQLTNIVSQAHEELGDLRAALTFGVAGILQSPEFLFRAELPLVQASEVGFDGFSMASRLSFLLWNRMPDEYLFQKANAGELSTRAQVYAEAVRMIQDDRFRGGLRAFFTDYLHLYELDHLLKDPKIFEHYDPNLGLLAAEETWRVIENLVLDEPQDFRNLMMLDHTFVNPKLASIYGLPAPSEERFARLPLDEDAQRRGLLGHISFLALHSHSTATSATRRGEAVRIQLLCQTIPAPPVNVDTSIPEPSGDRLTLRQRVEEHLEDPSCKGCHQLTDPIGLGLENYDSLGRYRTHDNGAPIDPAGELDGIPFSNAIELGERVAEHPNFAPCIAEMLVRYAIGRDIQSSERPVFRQLVERFEHHRYHLIPLYLELVTSPLFLKGQLPTELTP